MKPLEPNASLRKFLDEFGNSNGAFYLGHASVLCVLNGKKIIFDPVLFSEPYQGAWTFFPKQTRDPLLLDVDAVVVSHIHQDHYDKEYLRAVGGKAKIFIIGERDSLESDLSHHAIDFRAIPPGKSGTLFDGIHIYGVVHESNGIDSSAVIYNNDFCVYHGNDNYCDINDLKRISGVAPPIDLACIPYAYINWYPFLLENPNDGDYNKDDEANRLIKKYMDYCIEATLALDAKVVIPFGANLVLDDGDGYSPMNLAVKTPFEFFDYATQNFSEVSKRIFPFVAGDYLGKTGTTLSLTRNNTYESQSFRHAMSEFLNAREKSKAKYSWQPVDKDAFINSLTEKISRSSVPVSCLIRVELNYLNESLKIEIDVNKKMARWVDHFRKVDSFHHFKLDDNASAFWLNGSRFEEIIGMRRFTLTRTPNQYRPEVMRFMSTLL